MEYSREVREIPGNIWFATLYNFDIVLYVLGYSQIALGEKRHTYHRMEIARANRRRGDFRQIELCRQNSLCKFVTTTRGEGTGRKSANSVKAKHLGITRLQRSLDSGILMLDGPATEFNRTRNFTYNYIWVTQTILEKNSLERSIILQSKTLAWW